MNKQHLTISGLHLVDWMFSTALQSGLVYDYSTSGIMAKFLRDNELTKEATDVINKTAIALIRAGKVYTFDQAEEIRKLIENLPGADAVGNKPATDGK